MATNGLVVYNPQCPLQEEQRPNLDRKNGFAVHTFTGPGTFEVAIGGTI